MSFWKREQTEERHRWYDTVIKGITAVVGVPVATLAIWQYLANQRSEITRRIDEAQKPLDQMRLETYVQATTDLSKLLNVQAGEPLWMTARDDFLTLYDGKLQVVESDSVAKEMYVAWKVVVNLEPKPNSMSFEVSSRLEAATRRVVAATRRDVVASYEARFGSDFSKRL